MDLLSHKVLDSIIVTTILIKTKKLTISNLEKMI